MIICSSSNIDLIRGVSGYGTVADGATDWRIENTPEGVFNILNSPNLLEPNVSIIDVGNVGIGTIPITGTNKLQVQGAASVSGLITANTLTASGLITANAGLTIPSGQTLTSSGTLTTSVINASGLITGNAGLTIPSGQTLTANLINASGLITATQTTAGANDILTMRYDTTNGIRFRQTLVAANDVRYDLIQKTNNVDYTTPVISFYKGNVGIGTTNPINILQVGSGGRLRLANDNADFSLIGSSDANSATNPRIIISGTTRSGNQGNIEYLSTTSTGMHAFYTTDSTTERMRIASNGNVAIGTTDTATYKLNVGGTINATSVLVNGTAITAGAPSQWAGTTNIYYNGGNVGIGTTDPVGKIHIYNDNTNETKLTIQNNISLALPTLISVSGATGDTIAETFDRYISFPYSGTASTMTYTFTTTEALTCDILVIGGGGSGGFQHAGGGGAGALIYSTNVPFTNNTLYTITVGQGGASKTGFGSGFKGNNSSITGGTFGTTYTAEGGGYGGGYNDPRGGSGGSGGGEGGNPGGVEVSTTTVAIANNSLYGFNGGTSRTTTSGTTNWLGAGGGGAGSVGVNSTDTNKKAGNGGSGRTISITGTAVIYAGGGGGSALPADGINGSGGSGGGGAAGTNGVAGTDGLGGGGGAGGSPGVNAVSSGKGGSGIVIIRYRKITQSATLELIRGTLGDTNTDYKIGNYDGVLKIMSSVSSVDSNSILITSNGNVSIGNDTITPYKLNITGDLNVSGGYFVGGVAFKPTAGLADTATALATSRNIAGVGFNGTGAIDIPYFNLTNKITAGNGISLTPGSASTSPSISTNLTAGNGISISAAASPVISTNLTAGTGISISAAASPTISANISAGTGITFTPSGNNISISAGASSQWTGAVGAKIYYNGDNVGIGTTDPIRRLHVQTGMRIGGAGAVIDFGDDYTTQIYRHQTSQEIRFVIGGVDNSVVIKSDGKFGIGIGATPNTTLHIDRTFRIGGTNGPVMFFGNDDKTQIYRNGTSNDMYFYIDGGDRMILTSTNFNVYVNFTVSGGKFKSWRIEHPILEDKDLIHVCIEGPRADNLYRGRKQLCNGECEVNIDLECNTTGGMTEGTFALINKNTQVFVNNNETFDKVVGKVVGNKIIIKCENVNSSCFVDWLVIGERCDKGIINNSSTSSDGSIIVEIDRLNGN